MLALMAEREQTRTLLRAKLQKIFQKTAFGEEINAISVVKFPLFAKITKNSRSFQQRAGKSTQKEPLCY